MRTRDDIKPMGERRATDEGTIHLPPLNMSFLRGLANDPGLNPTTYAGEIQRVVRERLDRIERTRSFPVTIGTPGKGFWAEFNHEEGIFILHGHGAIAAMRVGPYETAVRAIVAELNREGESPLWEVAAGSLDMAADALEQLTNTDVPGDWEERVLAQRTGLRSLAESFRGGDRG